ncbi:glycosyltransferase family 4 protein [Marinospirillum perlucidum]|uniref:glycosyltransferase family 4 protein n=1 Tax=Marinospirillum perlucidum TaxID=1982602 RepID=UPI001C49C814|nr:glycosyltransferase family 4 protein [Marinospirillum perlucidum]
MKVLHFYKTYYPDSMGGVEQVIFQLAEGISLQGVDTDVLYLSKRGRARDEILGHHITHRSNLDFELASTGFSFSAIRDFIELAKTADIIHYHFPWPFMDLIHFIARTGKPSVVSYHSDIVKQKYLLKIYQPLMDRFLSNVDVIVAASPNYAESSKVLQQYKSKLKIIPYGLDESTYPEVSKTRLESWRQRLGENFFLFVGALRYYKGLTWLLKAAAKNGLPVVIAGGGGIEEELKVEAAKQGLSQVFFVGRVDDEDKSALLTLCYAMVFPSHLRSEAFGISLLEGAMYGKPLICCDLGSGMTYINQADVTGLVIPPADADALSEAMLDLWNNPEKARRMGCNARLRFESKFSSKTMVLSYLDLYKSLV